VNDPEAETWSSGALLQVARGQRRIIWLIAIGMTLGVVLGIASAFLGLAVFLLAPLIGLGLGIVQLNNVRRLAAALRSSMPWAYALLGFVLSFVPFLWLLLLLFLNQRATNVLKANGIKVGFMGAKLADFGEVSFGPDECNVCGKYLKNADERLECPKCRVGICDSCAVQTRVGGGMVESFSVTCPKCKAELVETRTKEAPAEEDFDEEEA